MVKVTLDASVLIGGTEEGRPEERAACRKLIELHEQKIIDAAVSSRFLQDQEMDTNRIRAFEVLNIARRLSVIQARFRGDLDRVGCGHLGLGPIEKKIYTAFYLNTEGWGTPNPSLQITLAKCDQLCVHASSHRTYFLTWDRDILEKHMALSTQIGIHVMSPEHFLVGGCV